MKIIKSFLLIAISLSATNLLQAQEIKTEVLKQAEVKMPPVAVKDNTPSPAPELKPMNGVVLKDAPVAVAETPSPFTKDKNNKNNTATTQPPKQMMPVTDVPVAKPLILPVPAPVVSKAQENQ